MFTLNFTLNDILGACLGFFIFPTVLLFPGYVVSWATDLFEFKQRQLITKHIIAILISVAIIPILVYLLTLFASFNLTKFILACFFFIYTFLIVDEIKKLTKGTLPQKTLSHYQKIAFCAAAGWVFFSIMSLVDLQWGDRLYNNAVSLDFATRVTMVNAITRTGVPPINPSFFPGHVEYITSLYYFWYILCSITDQLGANLVDSRMALIAGDAWCGLALMALIALYLKFRNQTTGNKAWKAALIGISLLTISGLDAIPALINMLVTRFSVGFMWPAGDIEHWNEQITAWIGSLFWVPHHVTAMVACLTCFLIFQYYSKRVVMYNFPIAIIAGLALASAVGLSTWVTITFSIFLGVWIISLFTRNNNRNLITLMILTGVVAVLSASPFLSGVIKGGTGASGPPIIIEVRRFLPLTPYIDQLSVVPRNIVYLALLPANYIMELGFFLIIGLLWLQQHRKKELSKNPFFIPEIILLCVVVFVCSFIRSAIAANDLGWRGWLFGQLIFLVWAVDILDMPTFSLNSKCAINIGHHPKNIKVRNALALLLLIGFSTSAIDVALLRFWPFLIDMGVTGFPNGLSPDTQLGQRTFAARLTHEFIDQKLPANIVIQQNPLTGIDRPSGLYGNRQLAISANAPYNVPIDLLQANMNQISNIFTSEYISSWDRIDTLCQEYFIDVLIVNDLDPLWNSLSLLHQQRTAFYKNGYYAVFACGNFIFQDDYHIEMTQLHGLISHSFKSPVRNEIYITKVLK